MSSSEVRELREVVDLLINLSRESLDAIDRCCNILETLLDLDNEINTEEMLERFR